MEEFRELIDLLHRTVGIDPNADGPFSEDVMASLSEKYKISVEAIGVARTLLNVGALCHHSEREWWRHDFKKVRSQISALSKASARLRNELNGLDQETVTVLERSGLAAKIMQIPAVMELLDRAPSPPTAHFERLVVDESELELMLNRPKGDAVGLATLVGILDDLSSATDLSQRLAGTGQKGRPEDSAMFGLMEVAFQVWVNFVGMPFALDWASDNGPITPAAQWSVDVARAVEPDAALSKVITASRKVQERSIKISNLDELKAFAVHFLKRSGWVL